MAGSGGPYDELGDCLPAVSGPGLRSLEGGFSPPGGCAFICKTVPMRFTVSASVEKHLLPSLLFLGILFLVKEKLLIFIGLSSAKLPHQSGADFCF